VRGASAAPRWLSRAESRGARSVESKNPARAKIPAVGAGTSIEACRHPRCAGEAVDDGDEAHRGHPRGCQSTMRRP
jgi:hypothetical protein